MTLSTTFLRALFLAAVAYLTMVPCAQATQNAIAFDNQSGEVALVKIVGPTTTQVHIEHTNKESVAVSNGDYYILLRYGSTEDSYRYTKGDSFTIAPPGGQFQEISITLHKVVGGKYQSNSIDQEEFEEAIVASARSEGESKNEIAAAEGLPKEFKGTPALYYAGSIHGRALAGRLKNGCEAWQVATPTGESAFVSRCDMERLDRLGFFATSAISINDSLADARKVQVTDNYTMIDFTKLGVQALYGQTLNDVDVYVVLSQEKSLLYYRAVGSRPQLESMGFRILSLLAANDSVNKESQILVDQSDVNVAEIGTSGLQMLIGKTNDGSISALIIDKSGNFVDQLDLN